MKQSILTVDVEDYFHVEAFSNEIPTSDWGAFSCRVEHNTLRLLDLLDECQARATFFILGWVAERFPALVQEIVRRGHEPACHSYWHRLVYRLGREEFRKDTLRAKNVIEQSAGMQVSGYRAPSYSITPQSLWALEILVEVGFSYDSSMFPIHHDTYGIPKAPRRPFRIHTSAGPLIEYPITTFRWAGQNFPVAGGGYLRILPNWYTRLGVARLRAEEMPLIVYVHPWEIDPEQPRIASEWKSRLRHYTNLRCTESRLRGLLVSSAPFLAFRESGLERVADFAELTSGRIT